MNLKERNEAIKKLFEECSIILECKGKDYSGEADAYRNFKETGVDYGIHPRQVLAIFLNKHLDAVKNAIKENPENPQRQMESFRESCKDAINYLAILAVWPSGSSTGSVPIASVEPFTVNRPIDDTIYVCPKCGREAKKTLSCDILECACQTPPVKMEPKK